MKTIIIGLGNPILGDDGVGWRIAEQISANLQDMPIYQEGNLFNVECLAVGGLTLMEHLIGYDRAILIDAITTRTYPPGTVHHFMLDELPKNFTGHTGSSHDTTIHDALAVGRSMGALLPEKIEVVAIEAETIYEFSEELTHKVQAALPVAVDKVMEILT